MPNCHHNGQVGSSDIIVDSTVGLRIHRGNTAAAPPKRRAWRKLQIIVDADTGELLASTLTTDRARDGAQLPDLLAQVDTVGCAMADGACDTASVCTAIETHRIDPMARRD